MKSSRHRFLEYAANVRRRDYVKEELDDRPNSGGKRASQRFRRHNFRRGRGALVREFATLLHGSFSVIIVLLSTVLLSAVVSLVPPAVMKLLVDDVLNGHPIPVPAWTPLPLIHRLTPVTPQASLGFLAVLLTAAAAATLGLDWAKWATSLKLSHQLAGVLRQRVHDKFIRMPLAKLSNHRSGGIVTRIMGDTEGVVWGVQNAIIVPIGSAMRILCLLVILVRTEWRLAVVASAAVPIVVALHLRLYQRLRPFFHAVQEDRAGIAASLTETFRAIRDVRIFCREKAEAKEFACAQHTMMRKQWHTAVRSRMLNIGWDLVPPGVTVAVILIGGTMVLAGSKSQVRSGRMLKAGDLVMFQAYAISLLAPLTSLIESFPNIQQNLASMDRILDVLEEESEPSFEPSLQFVPITPINITLDKVTFYYNSGSPVISDVSFEIPHGVTIGIVGPSGSGKTTLVNLIARLFEPASGRISVDGTDARAFRRSSYRSAFAMVLQEVYLFEGTIHENIAYGRRGASRTQVVEAARLANANDFICKLPEGYNTRLKEGGGNLSGGQRQRLSIARALLTNPRILILDEATSALDSESETLVHESLCRLMRGRTTIIISHRLSTVARADRIIVLDGGKVVEDGTHEKLVQSQGRYSKMYLSQQAISSH